MTYAVCCVPVSCLRAEPLHTSELVSQQLFGECCTVLEKHRGNWIKIICQYDGLEGWCFNNDITEIDEADFNREKAGLTSEWVNEITYNGKVMILPYGCSLAAMKNGEAFWHKNIVLYKGKVLEPHKVSLDAKTIKEIALKFLNTSYLWGGKSVFGIDCSGYTQTIYKFLGIPLLRNAAQQCTQGELVGFLQEALCGDLAFFDDENGHIIHVGMLLNAQEIIHASGTVRVDKIDNMGIIHSENLQRTHKLRIIKRML